MSMGRRRRHRRRRRRSGAETERGIPMAPPSVFFIKGREGERETRVLMALRHSVAIRGGRRREKFSFFPGFFRGCLGCQGRKEEGGRGEKKSHLLNDAIKPRESAGKEEEEE